MNYMKQIAEMLGVEIGERFNIKNNYGVIGREENPSEFYLGKTGYLINARTKRSANDLLSCLLGDKAYEIVKLPWKPKDGEMFYRIMADGTIMVSEWEGNMTDVTYYAFGNYFRTKAEAEAHKEEILKKMKEVMSE